MNYYNPYFIMNPTLTEPTRLTKILGKFNIQNFLTGTQKTLNIINQTIPIIKEGAPILKNAKTMFKIMNEFKRIDAPTTNISKRQETKTAPTKTNNGPNFFL